MDRVALPEEIIAERIVLKRQNTAFSDNLFRLIDHDRAHCLLNGDWVNDIQGLQNTKELLKKCQTAWDEKEFFHYAIFYKDTDQLIGSINFCNILWKHAQGELGYWISSSYQGRGLMAEAVKALEKEVFKAGIHRLEIRVPPMNKKSVAVARRCGFTEEGTLRGNRLHQGHFIDILLFSRLATDD